MHFDAIFISKCHRINRTLITGIDSVTIKYLSMAINDILHRYSVAGGNLDLPAPEFARYNIIANFIY